MLAFVALALGSDHAVLGMPEAGSRERRAPEEQEHEGMIEVRTGEFALLSTAGTATLGIVLAVGVGNCPGRCDDPAFVSGAGITLLAAAGAVPAVLLLGIGEVNVLDARHRRGATVSLSVSPLPTGLSIVGTW